MTACAAATAVNATTWPSVAGRLFVPLICSKTNTSTNVYHLTAATAWLALFGLTASSDWNTQQQMLLGQQQSSAVDTMITHCPVCSLRLS